MPLDSNGYSAPDIVELQTDMSQTAKTLFGALFDTSSDAAAGHFIGVTAIEIADVFKDLLELYSNLNPNTSEGRMLDNLALIGGLIRKGKAFSTGVVTFSGTPGTNIPADFVVYVNGDSTRRFLTRNASTISLEGTVDVRVIAETAGATQAPAGTLTEINSPLTGLDTVTNAKDITIGTDSVESDLQLRNRRNNTLSIGGNGTAQAIRAALEQLDGVTAVRVITNDTFSFQDRGDGIYQRPPKSIECVVEGGDELEILETIALTKSATSEAFGMIMAQYTDFTGNIHQIRYTRPEDVDITVEVSYKVYSEEVFPQDGEALLIEEILEFASTEYLLGKDVLRDRLYQPVFQVPGVANIEIRIGRGDALPSASLSEDDISIELYEKAVLTSSNIYIQRTY